jgi:CheY-like chemotaxis protein
MEPVTLLVAAGAYVAAEFAKRSADSVINAAYKQLESFLRGMQSVPDDPGQLDVESLKGPGLERAPEVESFEREVLAHSSALRRARLIAPVVEGASILWVDDNPANNRNECRLLGALGASVEQVRSTQEVLDCLARQLARKPYDLLLSDIKRDGVADAGLQMLGRLPPGAPPVVFYTGRVDESWSVPRGAFGIADRPEPLLHLVFDVLERKRV